MANIKFELLLGHPLSKWVLNQLFWGEGTPTKIDYSKKLAPLFEQSSLLEDLGAEVTTDLSRR